MEIGLHPGWLVVQKKGKADGSISILFLYLDHGAHALQSRHAWPRDGKENKSEPSLSRDCIALAVMCWVLLSGGGLGMRGLQVGWWDIVGGGHRSARDGIWRTIGPSQLRGKPSSAAPSPFP